MSLHLVQRRPIWFPTLSGWALLALLAAAPLSFWWFRGESFLSLTHRLPAEVLVVDGWIGRDGLAAAKAEFERGGYRYLVTAGGTSDNSWDERRWNFAEVARSELLRTGLAENLVIAAPARDTGEQRTFESAEAVERMLAAKGIRTKALNVFTLGAHARRSRLVYSRVLPSDTSVGVICWIPSDEKSGPWWRSSERAELVIMETASWLYEVLLKSGRSSNSSR